MKICIVGITENDFIRGVERYTLELTRYLAKLYPDIRIFILRGHWQNYYDELLEFDNIKLITVENLKNRKINRHYFMAFKLFDFIKKKNIKPDIIHYPNTLPIIKRRSIPSVITIHDIAEFFVPEKYSPIQRTYRKWMVKVSAKNADFIITDSRFSKESIIRKLNIQSPKIKHIYLGIEHFLHTKDKLSRNNLHPIIDQDYILYWSVIEHTKGIIETLKAFQILQRKYHHLKLLVIGKLGNAYKDFLNFIYSNKNIVYLGYVKDEELKQYIRKAKVVLFPSRYEGFGFPPLEAFLLNNNIVASGTTSLGEITKDFAEHINPENIYDIVKKVENLLLKPKKFSHKEKLNIIKKFSWENTARETFFIYKTIYKSIRR